LARFSCRWSIFSSPTGLTVYNQLFAEIRPLFAGNVTGGYTNSYNFIPNANGFHIGMLTNLEELFNTADSRYVRKLLVGNTAVATGVDISGLNINLPTYATIPTGIFPTGRIISVSGLTYVFENRLGYTGFVSQVPFTGFSVPSGGMLTGTNIIVSGDGQVQTRIAGNNIIVVSGGGVNQFAVAAGPFRQGNMILSGSSSITITSGATASGTFFTFSLPGGAGGGGVTGIGVNLNTPLWTGGFVISGESGTSVRIANVGGNVSGIIIGSLPPSPGGVTGFSNVFQTPLFTGGLVISGAGGITTSLLNLGNNTTGIVISSLPAGVTGFGLAALSLFTGSFIVSGQNNLTVTLANMGNNTSGFIIDDSYLNDQLTLQMWNMVGY
jgi:hypothetical protein